MRPTTEPLYTVEKIIGKTVDKGEVLYRTKWVGYEKESDITWEPVESFQLCPWVVDEFETEQAIALSIEHDLMKELERLSKHKIKKRIHKIRQKHKREKK